MYSLIVANYDDDVHRFTEMAGKASDYSSDSSDSDSSYSTAPTYSVSTQSKSSTSRATKRKQGQKPAKGSKKRGKNGGKKSKWNRKHQTSSSESSCSDTSSAHLSSKKKFVKRKNAQLFSVFQKHYSDFVTMACSSLHTLTNELFSSNFISNDVLSGINTGGSELERASKLLNHVMNKIELHPLKLSEFIKILQDIPSIAEQAKEIMGRHIYHVSTEHAP